MGSQAAAKERGTGKGPEVEQIVDSTAGLGIVAGNLTDSDAQLESLRKAVQAGEDSRSSSA